MKTISIMTLAALSILGTTLNSAQARDLSLKEIALVHVFKNEARGIHRWANQFVDAASHAINSGCTYGCQDMLLNKLNGLDTWTIEMSAGQSAKYQAEKAKYRTLIEQNQFEAVRNDVLGIQMGIENLISTD